MTPFKGGRVRFPDGDDRYPNGKAAWRCAACGRVGPWQAGWGGYWSIREEEAGLYADDGAGYPVWCSGECATKVQASGACSAPRSPTVTRKRRGR